MEVALRPVPFDRAVDDPNLVVFVAWFDDIEDARRHAGDPELRTVMDAAGVIGEPMVQILEAVEVVDYG